MAQKNADPKVRVLHFGCLPGISLDESAYADSFVRTGLSNLGLRRDQICERLPEIAADHLVLDDVQRVCRGVG
jgi:hypothetical protein